MKNILVAQSGGPTAAINATLAGVIREARKRSEIDRIYGAFHGVAGILEDEIVELDQTFASEKALELLEKTPAAALGSCRLKLKASDENADQYGKIIEIFRKYEIHYFVYIGGNDSMDTVLQLSKYCAENGIDDICVVGAPKTIDNDLCGIDHCPGFGSAAKYIASVCVELEREIDVYDVPNVIIIEMMGRHAGWLTAAAALAQEQSRDVPYLIYLEEIVFDTKKFIRDIRAALESSNRVIVAVSEGIHDADGHFICEACDPDQETDAFGHKQLAGTGRVLARLVKDEIGCKVRAIEPNLMQRCAAHILSRTDTEESKKLGQLAVSLCVEHRPGMMASLTRVSDEPYEVRYTAVPIEEVANKEKKVPLEWIAESGNGVTEKMISYLRPLVQGELLCEYENGIPKFLVIPKQ
ncbi:MAG: 6-phosphofructokinase [Lachnospiraceae bacterium]|nr:6-phosphofructokinase [Lachnospiraceae bacterium]